MADPKLKVPSRWEVTAEIRKLFKEKKAQVVGKLSQVEHFCCTNDAGSSSGGKSFVDVNVHYLTKNFEPKKKIVSVFEMKELSTTGQGLRRQKSPWGLKARSSVTPLTMRLP